MLPARRGAGRPRGGAAVLAAAEDGQPAAADAQPRRAAGRGGARSRSARRRSVNAFSRGVAGARVGGRDARGHRGADAVPRGGRAWADATGAGDAPVTSFTSRRRRAAARGRRARTRCSCRAGSSSGWSVALRRSPRRAASDRPRARWTASRRARRCVSGPRVVRHADVGVASDSKTHPRAAGGQARRAARPVPAPAAARGEPQARGAAAAESRGDDCADAATPPAPADEIGGGGGGRDHAAVDVDRRRVRRAGAGAPVRRGGDEARVHPSCRWRAVRRGRRRARSTAARRACLGVPLASP